MKIDKQEFRKGLAVNREKSYIQKLPDYKFTRAGKLANRLTSDIEHTTQILKEDDKLAARDLSAAELKAIITIAEMSYMLITGYLQKHDEKLFMRIDNKLKSTQGETNYQSFLDDYRRSFLGSRLKNKISDKELLLIELVINWFNNINPAFSKYYPLFDNKHLLTDSGNVVIMQELLSNLQTVEDSEAEGSGAKDLYTILREPSLYYPDSIKGQMSFILESWGEYLDETTELLHSMDILREAEKRFFAGGFPPPEPVEYGGYAPEEDGEYYSDDTDWMPSLVLLAKSTYVWLHQLSLKYGYLIDHLDMIPEAELKLMQSRGITGLWLIGIWERSFASQQIKSRNGDEQAIASAYSLDSYRIADKLGGEEAWIELSSKASKYGIRLGCDMVPNHTGIDSQWIVHHPDWFLQRKDKPYPGYSFRGDNLSSHPEVEVRIEDHYYAKTDAAVVFELHDRRDDSRRYIYHGNDGTGLPWNDTAQLDYTNKEVREAVLEEIISIAKKIPIIRFDAAMTLAKKHYQRLWFPEPGKGGDIPTRSDYSMSKAEFDAVFPREFWRDVVDRVAEEAPDTLLLAEAFWMMEGYFVRNLGMHRVYNSAFMHMMMREDNSAFRKTIINTLEYDKRILKRYVNFMSNPDEETAIGQFGDDDKYFGVCVMMCTLPGLPMLGHGQIEGFREKYGMEFAAPRHLERENRYLISRHEREIFPLLRKRRIFAEADNFKLFDFYTAAGELNENVMVFSNANAQVSSLVFYNNSYSATAGRIRETISYEVNENKIVSAENITIGQVLGLHFGPTRFVIFKDLTAGREYLRYCDDILTNGFDIALNGYEYHVFAEFTEIEDRGELQLAEIYEKLNKSGVASIDIMRKKMQLQPLHKNFLELFSYGVITNQEMLIAGELRDKAESSFFLERSLFPAIRGFHDQFMEMEHLLPWDSERLKDSALRFFKEAECAIIRHKPAAAQMPPSVMLEAWVLFREIRQRAEENDRDFDKLIEKYLLQEPLKEIFGKWIKNSSAQKCLDIVYLCLAKEELWQELLAEGVTAFGKLFEEETVQKIINVHSYNNVRWFHKEAFELLVANLEVTNRINRAEYKRYQKLIDLRKLYESFAELYKMAAVAGYQYDKLLLEINKGGKNAG